MQTRLHITLALCLLAGLPAALWAAPAAPADDTVVARVGGDTITRKALVRHLLTYKAQRHGMQVVLQNERYTSRTCPSCKRRHKPRGRRFRCPWCGFVAHRDVVGAWNIRKEYLGGSPVVGAMASPSGVRYHAHMRCSTLLPGAA